MTKYHNTYYIRKATINDFDDIIKIISSNKNFLNKEIFSSYETIKKYIKDETYFIIMFKYIPIGCGGYSECKDTNGVFSLTWLAILPEYHNNGYGSILLNYIEEKIKLLKGRILIILSGTDENNIYFYNKNKFIISGIIPKYYNENKGLIISIKKLK